MRSAKGVAFAAALLFLISTPAFAASDSSGCAPGQANALEGTGATLCEGEHWDGEDPYAENAGLVARYGARETPSFAAPASAGVHVGESGIFAFGALWGVGESSLHLNVEGRSVAWYARDGTNQVLGDTPALLVIVLVDETLGRDNAGADGNGVAWVVGVTGTVANAVGAPAPAGEQTGEGDCDQTTYESGDCARDNTAVTLMLP